MYIWQERVKGELDILLNEIKINGTNLNLLFRAPSGYGKTTAALICLKYLGFDNSVIYIPKNGYINRIDERKRFHFIDEVHLLKEPEYLYNFLDSQKFTFLMATNESGSLIEPLRNRCIPIIFSRYSNNELKQIVREHISNNLITDEMIESIVNRIKGNPRISKILCLRLNAVFFKLGLPRTVEDIEYILNEILHIGENGLTELDNSYIEYLKSCGGIAGITTIINGINIDKDTIMNEIEPNLIRLGIIQITSRGRKYLE